MIATGKKVLDRSSHKAAHCLIQIMLKKRKEVKGSAMVARTMTRATRDFACLLLLTCTAIFSMAQSVRVKASIDRNEILIGEPIRLQLEASIPMGTDAKWFPIDTIPHFEFIESAKIDSAKSMESKSYKQTLTITSFDSGRWVIPTLALEVNGTSYLTDSLPVSVAYSDFDPSQEYHDIKDILDVTNPYAKYANWALAALTLLSLLGVIYFLRKKAVSYKQPVPSGKPFLSPIEEAMHLLDELRKERLPQQGQVKLYYTRLNDILRSYMSRVMSSATAQKTSEELIFSVKESGMLNDDVISLVQTLRMADAVKFARYIPDEAYNDENMQTIKNSIEALNHLPSRS